MIKKKFLFIFILILLCSCGKKSDPVYNAQIPKILFLKI